MNFGNKNRGKCPPISKMSLNSSTPAKQEFIQTNDYKIKTSINSDKKALGSIVPSAQSRFSSLF